MLKDKLILASFISGTLYSFVYPTIHINVMRDIDESLFSIMNMITCIITIIVINLCNKFSKEMYSNFDKLLIAEIILQLTLTIYIVSGNGNLITYYILDAILFCTIVRSVICVGNTLKSKLYNEEFRAKFDNDVTLYNNYANIIGYGLGSILTVPLNISIIIMCVAVTVDNFLYLDVFYKNKKYHI